MDNINGIRLPFIPAGGVDRLNKVNPHNLNSSGKSQFNEMLNDELTKLKFSGHAQTRMESRNINLSKTEMLRLETAIEKAELKDAKESLVLMDEKAFIVNIKNRTVVTMLNKNQMDDNVITKIDSAVFA